MRPAQGKFRIHRMIKLTVLPAIVIVAVLADLAVLALVGIVTAMAGNALGILQIRLGQGHGMTEIAADLCMLAKQFPVAVPSVIKRYCLPLFDGVALLALTSVYPCMLVVPEMTGNTFGGRIFMGSGAMTAHAGYLGVATFELEIRIFRMIKQTLLPILRAVALGAVLAQTAVVGVLGTVAVHTFVRRFAAWLIRHMALIAGDRQMRTFQRKVSEFMSEG